MQNTSVYRRRIQNFIEEVHGRRYESPVPLQVEYTYDARSPIPIASLAERNWRPIRRGQRWGELWGSAWFRVRGTVPAEFAGKAVVALVDLGAEGCVFRNGVPHLGLTNVPQRSESTDGKRRIPILDTARGGEKIDILIEAGANEMFGYHGGRDFALRQADAAVFHPGLWQIALDLRFLFELGDALPPDSVRARRILDGLNRAANAWADGAGAAEVAALCSRLLKLPAAASATTAWAVGHAHIDLAWLWPVRETRRKAGRTFATALRLMEQYPDYVFGASQPQLYEWVQSDYPELFEQVRAAVAAGRWECQGAMWVEPDMNIPGGESLVRQLIYGKRYFREQFGKDVTNLWLPDVFGYSAALPQILKGAGVDYFMTQKISWNETNRFPHHTFDWEGIDGTRVRTHFPPADSYNAENTPQLLLETEQRFAQADVSDDWLQLYGIGDGGGGPSRVHIEYGRRAADTEGLPRLRFAESTEFFRRIGRIPAERLPVWVGELYLELHRGTYTTQSKLKKLNRHLELRARDAEFLAVVSGEDQRTEMQEIWKETLLNQFHDILPGSSITRVYEEAIAQSERNLARLASLSTDSLRAIHRGGSKRREVYAVWNTLSWDRTCLVHLRWTREVPPAVTDAGGARLPVQPVEGGVLVPVTVPSMGFTPLAIGAASAGQAESPSGSETRLDCGVVQVAADGSALENDAIRVTLSDDGTIGSIFDKAEGREVLSGSANTLLLWEDLPYEWDAWEISHYYRETKPEKAQVTKRHVLENGPLRGVISQEFVVGLSAISQRIVLDATSRLVRIENTVDWKETHKQLKVRATPALVAREATYEIQFGAISRPAHGNNTWDSARFEVAGHRFADLSQADYGLGLVNDCKYGHYIRDGVMELTLLRSPKDPDPTADIGVHDFVFGYYPHTGRWEDSDLLERSHGLNSPFVVAQAGPDTPAGCSEFRIDGGTVKIDTVKRAEDDDDVVLRLYETRGRNQSILLRSRRKAAGVSEVNLLEDRLRAVRGLKTARDPAFGSELRLDFQPYQIRTLKLRLT